MQAPMPCEAPVIIAVAIIMMMPGKNSVEDDKLAYTDLIKKVTAGQLDMYNYKLAEIAHEIDKINLNEITPIDALNILSKLKDTAS